MIKTLRSDRPEDAAGWVLERLSENPKRRIIVVVVDDEDEREVEARYFGDITDAELCFVGAMMTRWAMEGQDDGV